MEKALIKIFSLIVISTIFIVKATSGKYYDDRVAVDEAIRDYEEESIAIAKRELN